MRGVTQDDVFDKWACANEMFSMKIRYVSESNANHIYIVGRGKFPSKNSSEKDLEVLDAQFNVWFALAKSHLLLRYTIVRGRLGEAKQQTALTNKV